MSSRNDPSSRFYKDPNTVEEWAIKSYGCHELIIEVCKERGLPGVLRKPDAQADFLVIHVTATRAQYKAAQLEWLRRMTVSGPAKKPELSLF